MTSPAAPAADLDPDTERAQRHARFLRELAEIGMELARDLRDQARAPAEPAADDDKTPPRRPSPDEITTAFARISRAVRLTLMLETRFAEDRAARVREDPAVRAERQRAALEAKLAAEFAALPLVERRRDVLLSIVPCMIETACEREPHRFGDELYERCDTLINEELEDREVLDRPIPELMVRICRDLGIAPDWRQWDPQNWTGTGHELGPDDVAPKPARDAAPPTAYPLTPPTAPASSTPPEPACAPAPA